MLPITKITSRIGYKHAIFISSLAYVIYWFLLYQTKFHTGLFFITPILFAIQKSFFWPPYNADVALGNIKEQRGREVGLLFSLVELVSIVGPILGGFISYKLGFPILFILAGILMVLSVYPLFLSPEIYTRHQFHLKNFWQIVKKYPHNFFGYWGYAEDLMLMSLWPIFVYLVVPQVFTVGIIITFASLIAVVVMLYLGGLIDRFRKVRFLPINAVAYGLTWLFRVFAYGVPGVVTFDVLTRLGKGLVNVPLLSETFELAAGRGPDYAIAYSAFFEFSLSIGKIFTALVAIYILSVSGSMVNVFLVIGVLTMFYAFIRKK